MSIEKLPANASLKQVMDKFEEISFQDFSSIDIIVRNELPSKVKNGQVVVIDSDNGKIYMDNKDISAISIDENDIYVRYSVETESTTDFLITDKTKKINLHLSDAYKYKNGAFTGVDEVYIGKDDKWVKILDSILVVFDEGAYKNDFSINKTSSPLNGGTFNITIQNNGSQSYYKYLCFRSLFSEYSVGNELAVSATNKKIDLSGFKAIEVEIVPVLQNGRGLFIVGVHTENSDGSNYLASQSVDMASNRNKHVKMSINISNVNDLCFIKFATQNKDYSSQHDSYVYVKNVILKK